MTGAQPSPHPRERRRLPADRRRLPAAAAPLEPELLAFLRDGDNYPGHPRAVEQIETHMSWVFLTPEHAWKLKKPYRRDVLNYATRAARRQACVREVRLNRRLAPDVYLGVVAIRRHGDGQLRLDGHGSAVDWLVKMRRLPYEHTLEHRIRTGRAGRADAGLVVEHLLKLYPPRHRACISAARLRARTLADIEASRRVLLDPQYDLPTHDVARLTTALRAFVAREPDLLGERARAQRHADGHGDLRPEHVYLGAQPAIIDCLEFDRDLRLRDPVDELAFLALECERLGDHRWRDWLLDDYAQQRDDTVEPALVDFYQAAHALKRARLSVQHIGDPGTGPSWHWITGARDYLHRGLERLPR